MKAYKIWHNMKYFIRNDTTDELHVYWTTDVSQALDADTLYPGLPPFSSACRFFHDVLGFSLNQSKYDALYYQ